LLVKSCLVPNNFPLPVVKPNVSSFITPGSNVLVSISFLGTTNLGAALSSLNNFNDCFTSLTFALSSLNNFNDCFTSLTFALSSLNNFNDCFTSLTFAFNLP